MSRLDWVEYGWQWALRLLGATAFVLEVSGPGRGFVVTAAVGLMGVPTIYNIGRKR